ncbi:MAG: hypothetical protein JRJ24_16955 [Deltaproteobacteria bacterium]|nr:hypothetical protein [Deltaproteobacteria bacterium]
MTPVKRTTRDGAVRLRTTDAFQPLLEGVQKLEASLDRATKRIEDARRAKAEKRLDALVDGAVQNIYAEIAEADRQKEEDAFERKLFGKLLPRTFGQYIGLDEVPK